MRKIALAVLMLQITSCGIIANIETTHLDLSNVAKITSAMNESDVVAIMGQPDSNEVIGELGERVLVWNYVSSLRDGVKQTYSVVVKNGKVIRLPENNYNDTKSAIEKERKQLETNPVVIAEKEKIEKEQKRVRSIPSGTPHSINLEWDAVPSGYVGDNDSFDEIFNKFQFISAKDEYETQEEFVSRTTHLIDDSIYAFSVLASSGYDAEKKLWKIYLKEMSTYKPNLSNKGIIISENLEDKGTYVGTNAFGLEMDVFLEKETVKMLGCPSLVRPTLNFAPTLTLNMDSSSARYLGEKNIGIILISKIIKSSPTSIIKGETEPTIDARVHIISTTYKLGIELYQIWIYDKKTGQIFEKQFVHD